MGQIAMTDQEILEQFADVVVESLRIDRAKVTADAYLNDLGAESLDLLEITMETEDRFNILMPQKNILQVAQEVFGEGVLAGDGRLTEEGMKLLRRRTPEVDRLLDDPTPALADVSRMFLRVEVWIRMIRGLMEQSPRSCPKCDAAFGKAVAGRLKCAACGTECDIPSGDDLNRQWVLEYHQSVAERTAPLGAAVPAPAAARAITAS